jgi:hypothetical protein
VLAGLCRRPGNGRLREGPPGRGTCAQSVDSCHGQGWQPADDTESFDRTGSAAQAPTPAIEASIAGWRQTLCAAFENGFSGQFKIDSKARRLLHMEQATLEMPASCRLFFWLGLRTTARENGLPGGSETRMSRRR